VSEPDADDADRVPVTPSLVARTRAWLERTAEKHALSIALALRGIGLVSLCAFVSLHVQVHGLFGADGIDPMTRRLGVVEDAAEHPFFVVPTLFLFVGGSDAALDLVCVLGELASVAMVLGLAVGPAALAAWLAYLSFVAIGTPFIPLQWDTLLSEALVLAALAAPPVLRARLGRPVPPRPLALLAFWFLIGRLMFAAGWVKLASGDPSWSGLTALDHHFETQPLPTLAGAAMHFAPHALHAAGVVFTFLVELVLPFAILAGESGRRIAAGGFALLLTVIAITGNYGFFDFLAMVLALSLIDDAVIVRALARWRFSLEGMATLSHRAAQGTARVTSALTALPMLLGLVALLSTFGLRASLPSALLSLDETLDPFRLASGYGLFAVMTTTRPIVVFEGSDDGVTWHEYDYRWQSGDPARGPATCMPHMPRLDWMVWFAGLVAEDGGPPPPWISLVERGLLEAQPGVLSLFGRDPFHGRPPRHVRAVWYHYALAAPGDAAWWVRTGGAPFGPTRTAPPRSRAR
jgi:hypothetical protein